MNRKLWTTVIVLVLTFCLVGLAQGFPSRPITLMVHVAAGGGTDTGFRILAGVAEKYLGETIVVVNKPGGSGFICWDELRKSKADGYTIGVVATPSLAYGFLDPEMNRDFSLADFTPLVNHVTDPNVVGVPWDSPFENIEDLIEFARENPGELAAAMCGVSSDDYMACQLVERATGAKFNYIHFEGAAPSIAATMGKHTDLVFANLGELKGPHENEEMRVLVVLSERRSEILPEVPTFEEVFGRSLAMGSSRGLVAPANLPQEIADVLIQAFEKAIMDPDHIERMAKVGLEINFMQGKQYETFLYDMEETVRDLMGW
jgi:tripartite-type tricarboxylate transporter receptor subunit TctC